MTSNMNSPLFAVAAWQLFRMPFYPHMLPLISRSKEANAANSRTYTHYIHIVFRFSHWIIDKLCWLCQDAFVITIPELTSQRRLHTCMSIWIRRSRNIFWFWLFLKFGLFLMVPNGWWRKKFEIQILRQNNLESKIWFLLLSPYKIKKRFLSLLKNFFWSAIGGFKYSCRITSKSHWAFTKLTSHE